MPKFQFGEGVFCTSQNSKCQDLSKFQFSREGGVLYQIPEQGVLANLSKNFALPFSGSPCIADSLSHKKGGSSSGSSGRVRGGPRNMKSMRLPLAAIFFMTNFYTAGGAMTPSPPLNPLLGSLPLT